jgi:hypothetical protein
MMGLLAVVAVSVAGCNGGSGAKGAGPTVTTTTTHKSVVVINKHTNTVKAGTTVQIGVPKRGAAALINIGKPTVSRNRLSKSYGYAPAHGYYVTFPVKILNDGVNPLLIDRLDFWVNIAGEGKINTNDGNSPYSGAKTQLDTTELTTGQPVSNYLTFDVSRPHGTFVYGPGHKTSVKWTF